MALLSISQAAREWGTSRSRLYALKADGKLSFVEFPDGRPALDTSELVRVLGEPGSKQATPRQDTDGQGDQNGLREENRLLSLQLEVTQRERDAALEDKDRLLGILENQTRLLQGPETTQDRGKAGGDRMLAAVIVVVILIVVVLLATKVLPVERAGGQPKAETSTEDATSGLAGEDDSAQQVSLARYRELLGKQIDWKKADRDAKEEAYKAIEGFGTASEIRSAHLEWEKASADYRELVDKLARTPHAKEAIEANRPGASPEAKARVGEIEAAQARKDSRLTDAELGMPQGLIRKEKYEWLLEEKIKFLVGEVAEAKMAREAIRKAYVSTGDEALLPRNKEAQNRYYDLLDELRDTREKLEASKAKTAQPDGNDGN